MLYQLQNEIDDALDSDVNGCDFDDEADWQDFDIDAVDVYDIEYDH